MPQAFTDTIPGTDVTRGLNKDDLIVIAGAGGFIAGSLTRYFAEQGYTNIRAIDRKPLPDWYQRVPGVESICADLSDEANAIEAVKGAVEVYNLAADMGGMGFIERFRVECLRSILVNTHLIEAAYRAGVRPLLLQLQRLCLQHRPAGRRMRSWRSRSPMPIPPWPSAATAGRSSISEMFCQEYWEERGLKTAHRPLPQRLRPQRHLGRRPREGAGRDVPQGHRGQGQRRHEDRDLGRRRADPQLLYIDDCVQGIDLIMHCDELIATPINLGSSEMVSINQLVDIVEDIAGVKLERELQPRRAQGRRRPQQRQHLHPAGPRLGAQHAAHRWHGRDLCLDRTAVRRSQGRQARRRRLGGRDGADRGPADVRQPPRGDRQPPLPTPLAGGWIDQPFVSAANPEPPGSMVVVSMQPTVRYMERSGMATGTRRVAQRLWGDKLPAGRPPDELVRELYRAENEGLADPSGSQDMVGLIYPGISRLDYDASVEGGWFPCHIESTTDPEVVAWLERVVHLVPLGPRPDGYNPLLTRNLDAAWVARLGACGAACYEAIVAMDLAALGDSLNENSLAWRAILPNIYEHDTIKGDLWGLLEGYMAEYPGAMQSGCGGGYIIVAADEPPAGSARINVRA